MNIFDSSNQFDTKLIAGGNSGKKVFLGPTQNCSVAYESLLAQSEKQNYWATTALNAIHSLSSGPLHLNNLFVDENKTLRSGEQEYKLVLPGITATVMKYPDDSYILQALTLSNDYGELQEEEEPYLCEATYDAEKGWRTKRINQVSNIQQRVVAVSDIRPENSREELDSIFEHVGSASGVSGGTLKKTGFDIHFTPGDQKIGGMRRFKEAIRPRSISRIKASSLLLAKSMYDSRDVVALKWVSELGGSGILTQAMGALADSGAKLEKHEFFMVKPTTNPDKALAEALRLEMSTERNYKNSNPLDIAGRMGEFKSIRRRLAASKNGHDYAKSKALMDALKACGSLQSAALILISCYGGLGGAALMSKLGGTITAAAAANTPAAASFISGVVTAVEGFAAGSTATSIAAGAKTVATGAATGATVAKTADVVIEALLPDFHAKQIASRK